MYIAWLEILKKIGFFEAQDKRANGSQAFRRTSKPWHSTKKYTKIPLKSFWVYNNPKILTRI
jgi:hypothetical protein